jgi:uncharacterized membrane protein
MAPRKKPMPMPKPVRIVRDHVRLFSAAAAGLALLIALPSTLRLSTRLLVGWDFGATIYLVLAALVINRFDLKRVQVRAAEHDEGGVFILVLTVAAAVASLAAIVSELGAVRAAEGGHDKIGLVLVAGTIMLSWTLVHVIFALHYAHEYYRHPADPSTCLIFPGGGRPDYWDFIYFSFVIGMTFQVSDVQVAAKTLRRIVVAHGVVSFVFDVAIIALMVNIGANLI